ncbi:E3 ubiquitin-protein ligase MIB2 isoform X3 [Rhipicephalus microplus]|uniref:E3 ubiquitin-protein ligase MIB2 isoform X3 n=1 Tax=Rhipicephalus microplus TaxID=6941 RepID=UPI003F6C34B1
MGKEQSRAACTSKGDVADKGPDRFKIGDRVAVTMDVETFRLLQNDYGGWEAQMSLIFGNVGIVQRVLPNGGIMVNYKVANATWQLNPVAVEKLIAYKPGDKVKVCVTPEAMKELQKGHGGYYEHMRPSIGKVGIVLSSMPDYDVYVRVCNRVWLFNPLCLEPAPNSPIDNSDSSSSQTAADNMVDLVGNLEDLRQALEHFGEVVQRARRRSLQESPLHTVCYHGNEDMAKTLIDAGNDVNVKDIDGNTPLHYCAVGIAERILSKRLNLLNVAKNDGFMALHLAAKNGHIRVVKTLLSKRQCDMNAHASKGETPLMLAAFFGHWDIVEILVEAGADVNRQDQDGDTVLHYAISRHHLIALHSPDTSNSPTLSAIARELPNERLAPLCYLANRGADFHIMNNKGISPLIMAAATDILEHIAAWASRSRFTVSEASRVTRQSSASPLTREKCKICIESEANVVFQPCGHRTTCQECSVRCKVCLTCAVPIQEKVDLDGMPVRGREQNQTTPRDLDSRLQELEDRHTCNICMEKPRDVVFMCGHGSCKVCAENLDLCHMCRVPIERKIALYLD